MSEQPKIDQIDFNILPIDKLKSLAENWKLDLESENFALKLDQEDFLRDYRNQFFIPKKKDLPNSK